MTYRTTAGEWSRGRGDHNREAMRSLVGTRAPPGLLAYRGDAVWSVTCFFVPLAV